MGVTAPPGINDKSPSPEPDKYRTANQFFDKGYLLEQDEDDHKNSQPNFTQAPYEMPYELSTHLETMKNFEEHAPSFIIIKRKNPLLEIPTRKATHY